jgi:K+-transporting ATPase KdpF subunit
MRAETPVNGRPEHGPDVPAGISVGVGAVVVVAAAMVAAAIPPSAAGPRLGLPAAALAAFAAVTADWRAAVPVTVLGYLVFDGFLVNRLGELAWHGAPDARRFAVFAGAALAGLAVGAARSAGGLRRREWHGAGPGVRAVDTGAVRRAGVGGARGGAVVNVENAIGLVLAVALTVFLVLALLLPEKF